MSTLLEQASLVMIPSGYKEDIVYSQIPTSGAGDLSFTRASNGTRINSSGLVEVCPWNLEQYSEDLPNAIWAKASLTFNSTVTAPNGTSTAQNYSTAGAYAYAIQVVTVSSGEYYTASCYLKYTSGVGYISIAYADGPGVNYIRVTANLINGTIGSIEYGGNGANGTATITSVGDGWYRVTVSGTLIIGSAGLIVSNLFYGATTFSIWGAQLNIGSTAKPYFPTTDRLNVPRLTYQNGGGGCPSLLLEKQSTNLFLYSEEFSSGNGWFPSTTGGSIATRTADYGISPDGTQNADRIQLALNGQSYADWVSPQYSTGIGVVYTYSIWMKSLSGTPTIFFMSDGSVSTAKTLTTEWVRYTHTFTAPNSAITPRFLLTSSTSSSADLLAWGAQFEQSSYATSYIPTTSSSATRVADVCKKTGISSLIGQTSGTVFVDAYIDNIQARANNILFYLLGSGVDKYVLITNSGGVSFTDFPNGNITNNGYGLTNGRHKFAIAYANNDFAFYIDGNLVGVDTSGTPSACSEFGFFYYGSGYDFPLKVNEAVLFKTRLTNAELASLTTI